MTIQRATSKAMSDAPWIPKWGDIEATDWEPCK